MGAGAFLWANSTNPRTLLLLGPVLFLRMALNAIDGMLAREFNQKTPLGAILNELCDVISDTALYLPLGLGWGLSPILVILVVILGIISEMAGVLGVMVGSSRRYDGPMGKSDRAFVFGATGLAIGCGAPTGIWETGMLCAMLILLVATIGNRARMALRESN